LPTGGSRSVETFALQLHSIWWVTGNRPGGGKKPILAPLRFSPAGHFLACLATPGVAAKSPPVRFLAGWHFPWMRCENAVSAGKLPRLDLQRPGLPGEMRHPGEEKDLAMEWVGPELAQRAARCIRRAIRPTLALSSSVKPGKRRPAAGPAPSRPPVCGAHWLFAAIGQAKTADHPCTRVNLRGQTRVVGAERQFDRAPGDGGAGAGALAQGPAKAASLRWAPAEFLAPWRGFFNFRGLA